MSTGELLFLALIIAGGLAFMGTLSYVAWQTEHYLATRDKEPQ